LSIDLRVIREPDDQCESSTYAISDTLAGLARRLVEKSVFSIASRYPGVSADQQAAEEAMTTAEAVRTAMRVKLGLL
jgi:hypothetical protein